MPFHGAFEEDLFRKISTGKYKFPDYLTDKNNKTVELSEGAKNLVKKMFTMDQRKRPTASQILKNSWLTKIR
jgi:serine/threonine protein kinase